MDQYEHCLTAMKRLLDADGREYWSEWLSTDIQLWHDSRDTSHHLLAYGASGTLNDILIDLPDRVLKVWANALYEWLRSVCYFLAGHGGGPLTAAQLANSVGGLDPIVAGMAGGDRNFDVVREFSKQTSRLQGSRCKVCGHTEVPITSIEDYVAQRVLPALVFDSCERLTLQELVDRVYALDIPEAEAMRRLVANAAIASGIKLSEKTGWMCPCRACGSTNTAICYWEAVAAGDGNARFRLA